MYKKEIKYVFDGWFTISMPENWEYNVKDDLLSIISKRNPKGILQISFFYRNEHDMMLTDIAEMHLNRFLKQYEIEVEENTFKIMEAPIYTIANASGKYDGEFIKVWTIVNEDKMLLVTYISSQKSRELSVAENIVYSINFNV